MQSDFNSLCKDAREGMSVPPIPLAAIRKAAGLRSSLKPRKRWTGSIAAALAGSTLLAAVAGAAVWTGTHIKVDDRTGVFQIRAQKVTHLKTPTFAALRLFVRNADFPILLPTGLPAGTTIASANMFNSSAVMVQYNLPGAWRRSDHLLSVILAKPSTVGDFAKGARGSYEMMVGRKGPGSVRWAIGKETVLVMSSTITPAELARVKSAMQAQAH